MAIIISILIILAIVLSCYFLIKPARGNVESITVGDSKTLTVGIISDTQLPTKTPEDGKSPYKDCLKKSLELLKENNIDTIIFAGDLGDLGSAYSYRTYNEVFDSVFTENAPETVYIMGNHDNWFKTDFYSSAPKQRLYAKEMNSSPYIHKVINGYHFIAASPDRPLNTLGFSKSTLNWIDEQIQIAEKDSKDKPIFVVTHHAPKDTVYGSDDWNDPGLDEVLKKYENVVSFSGHSHYSLMDERSLYQKNYTAIQTQSLSYIELEKGKFDAFYNKESSIPQEAGDYPFLMIMKVNDSGAQIERWNINEHREEKADNRWTLNFPLKKETFSYTDKIRNKNNSVPVFNDTSFKYIESVSAPDDKTIKRHAIEFTQAQDDDLIHSYELKVTGADGKSEIYTSFSDFYKGENNIGKTIQIPLSSDLKNGTYTIKVTALDSLQARSSNSIEGTITIK